MMINRALWAALVLGFLLAAASPVRAAVVSVGTFPDLAPAPSISIPAGTFLVPVQIAGANNLQHWQFDLLFDNTVVEEVDPLDGSVGIHGAEFTPADASTQAFILGGFPFNALGLVDDVAGSYPSLLVGPSGDGILAYVLFRFLDGQERNDPGFAIQDVVLPAPVPVPATLALLAGGLSIVSIAGRRRPGAINPSSPSGMPPGHPFTGITTTSFWSATTLAALLALMATVGAADAQTTGNGPYYAWPSWDQTLPSSTRFIVLSNFGAQAVLDRETGLVWEKAPSPGTLTWFSARFHCNGLALGNRRGWRLPTIQELASLADADPSNANNPRLPVGHPFTTVPAFATYWSATTFLGQDSPTPTFLGWHLFLSTGQVGAGSNKFLDNFAGAWCVRGGQGVDPQ